MTKLSKNQITLIPIRLRAGASIKSLAKNLKVTEATIAYHVKKAENNQKLEETTWKNNQKSTKTTTKNNQKEGQPFWKNSQRPKLVNANGKPFSYSATLLFWGSMIALTAFNVFFLWSTRGN